MIKGPLTISMVLPLLCGVLCFSVIEIRSHAYANGYEAGWKFGEAHQRDIFFNEMDAAVKTGTHQGMTIWDGKGDRKMSYMFYKLPASY